MPDEREFARGAWRYYIQQDARDERKPLETWPQQLNGEMGMIKLSVGIAAAVAAMAVAAEPAAAQAAGAGVPVPGSANAAAVVGGNRELNAGYNSIVGNADKRNQPTAARPAKLGEITVGSTLRDVEGTTIGTIFSVDSEGAVVASGDSRVKVPLIAFGLDDTGLLLAVTAQKFWELRAKGKPAAQ